MRPPFRHLPATIERHRAPPPSSPVVVPIRNFIEHSLYAPSSGYFSRHADLPILSHRHQGGRLRKNNFNSFKGRAAYESYLSDTFAGKTHGWMTPVELYSPYLGNAVANRVAASYYNRDKNSCRDDLTIVEFGGGRGTLARDILIHLRSAHARVFQKTKYHLVDISQALSEQQAAATREFPHRAIVHGGRHALDWLLNDAARCVDVIEKGRHVHVLAFELLDNLPHDLFRKIIIPSSSSPEPRYQQAYVDTESRQLIWADSIDPIAAPALSQYVRHAQDNTSATLGMKSLRNFMDRLLMGDKEGAEYVWIPTVAHQILSAIAPLGASLTVADFTEFPGALPHTNGPVVQRVQNGVATVYDSVLEAPHGEVDIMFPTDFEALEKEYHGRAISQSQFFREFADDGDIENSTCQSGYNPILQEFKNTKFLLVDP